MTAFEQAGSGIDRRQQAIADKQNIVIDSYQASQAVGACYDVELGAGTLTVTPQLRQFKRDAGCDAYDALAIHGQGKRQLVPCQSCRSDSQERLRQDSSLARRFEHR